MFIDKVTIKISSGRGGNGAATFRREKFVAHGGPDGGDGGRGGSVYLEATDDMSTLLDFQHRSAFKADDGEKGGRNNRHGKSGKDCVIKVPCGTIVRDSGREFLGQHGKMIQHEAITIADLQKPGDRVLVASGGRGGQGNPRFKNQLNRVPSFAEPGESAIERELELELKMIADVGIIGFPNAGKSTLISQISAAKPKIADYAFTTLQPNLGVIRKETGDAFVVADIPGLIEGASEGHGLGYEFLKHIERTKVLVHLVDVWGLVSSNLIHHKDDKRTKKDFSLTEKEEKAQQDLKYEDPVKNFQKLNLELNKYSEKLARKPVLVVLNKIEAYPEDELAYLITRFKETINGKVTLNDFELGGLAPELCLPRNSVAFATMSAVTGQGVEEFKRLLSEVLDNYVPSEEDDVEVEDDPYADDHDDSTFEIERKVGKANQVTWFVDCGKLERIMKITNLREPEPLNHLFRVVRSLGVFEAIKAQGAEIGDLLNIDGVDFTLDEVALNAVASQSS